MPVPDYYSMLEVPSRATLVQIKKSYRRLVRLHHPDLHEETQDTRIKQLNEAYAVLSNATRRAAYDALLLEQLRATVLLERTRQQQAEGRLTAAEERQEKMTWVQGIVGFFHELKKGMKDER
ncbi:MAG: J domain-containing protein [Chloroflexi bacterium]|nr:J domain-containing protein [Ktedonobacteraceae bacterium]MBV9022037.1 J domain-containing protein [Ktedonobacteraceae bacterium]MBV9708586.1 J domain-containing protein [Chloroflexota bacterium]